MIIPHIFTNKYVTWNTTWYRRNKRGVLNIIKWIVGVLAFSILSFLIICRLELNARLYLKQWIAPSKPIPEPLSPTCFNHQEAYITPYSTYKKHSYNFIPGIPIWEEYTCYDYASLLQPLPSNNTTISTTINNKDDKEKEKEPTYYIPNTIYHTTWSSINDVDFTPVHLATIKSFLATQPLNSSELIIWIHPDDEVTLKENLLWDLEVKFFTKVRYQVYQPSSLLENTILQDYVTSKKQENEELDLNAFIADPEILKLLVLYQYGGVWFDLNTFFIRDLTPLLEHEWISQGKCQSSMVGNPFDGDLWHFYAHSPFLCELLYGATTFIDYQAYNNHYQQQSKKNENENSVDNNQVIKDRQQKKTIVIKHVSELSKKMKSTLRGSGLYQRIYRNIIREGIKPWTVTPWCFTNPSQCKNSNSLPSPFDQKEFSPLRLRQIFAIHFKQPKLSLALSPSGSIYEYLEKAQQW